MPAVRLALLTLLALAAFAGNSLLCRAALANTQIDATSFTLLRMLSGALVLWLLVRLRKESPDGQGNWYSSLALFAYAIGFSYSYRHLPAAAGALILFGAVQITMISTGLWRGERFRALQMVGLILAAAGLIFLLLPGLSAPPLQAALLMLGAGIAWGIYSLRGKTGGDPIKVTAGNFLRAVPLSLGLYLLNLHQARYDVSGIIYALLSGAIASGLGYAIWYTVLPFLKSTTAATLQLSVPVIAAIGSILFLNEAISVRLLIASLAILSGIALVLFAPKR